MQKDLHKYHTSIQPSYESEIIQFTTPLQRTPKDAPVAAFLQNHDYTWKSRKSPFGEAIGKIRNGDAPPHIFDLERKEDPAPTFCSLRSRRRLFRRCIPLSLCVMSARIRIRVSGGGRLCSKRFWVRSLGGGATNVEYGKVGPFTSATW